MTQYEFESRRSGTMSGVARRVRSVRSGMTAPRRRAVRSLQQESEVLARLHLEGPFALAEEAHRAAADQFETTRFEA